MLIDNHKAHSIEREYEREWRRKVNMRAKSRSSMEPRSSESIDVLSNFSRVAAIDQNRRSSLEDGLNTTNRLDINTECPEGIVG